MNNIPISNKIPELDLAIKAAQEAGNKILKIYEKGFKTFTKTDNSPVTDADLQSNKIIKKILSVTKHSILSEEDVDDKTRLSNDIIWIIDPLDGTSDFIDKTGEFTVMIALVQNQKPILGVIFVPAKGELYFSAREMGAFKVVVDLELYDVDSLIDRASKIPFERDDKTFTIVASRSHMSVETEEYVQQMKDKHGEVKLISKGSSLKLCMVAEGKADAYPRYATTMEWDTGAGDAICRMAGFQVLQYNSDQAVEYNKENLLNPWFLVK